MVQVRSPIQLITEALQFAAEQHASQRRKGECREPYVNHICEVANMLAHAGADAELVAAGLLHDTVEDTGVTQEEIAERFGPDVAGLVGEVTDDKTLPKAVRKQLQIEHAPKKSARAKLIKLADKTSNLRALAKSPPADWDIERCNQYVDWAESVVAGLRGVHQALEDAFDEAARAARSALQERAGTSASTH